MAADGNIDGRTGDTVEPVRAEMESRAKTVSPLWLLIIIGAALLFFTVRNGRPGHYVGDELFYMVGGMNAVQQGRWLVPIYLGRTRLQKPPLNYWLVAISFRVLGVGLWQARLPSALAGVLCIWLAYLLASRAFACPRAGLYAACVLLASYAFARQPHWATTDVVLTALMLAAFYGFAVTMLTGSRWGAVMAWGAMGTAFLEKGPVGVAVPLAAAGLWRLLQGGSATVRWRWLCPPVGLLLFVAIALPWPVLVVRRLGLEQVLHSWGGEAGRHVNVGPAHFVKGVVYYSWAVLRGLLPWSLLLLFYAGRRRLTDQTAPMWLLGLLPPVGFALCVGMLRIRYVMVSMAAFAGLFGYAMARLEERPEEGRVLWRVLGRLLELVPAFGIVMGLLLLVSASLRVRTHAAIAIAMAAALVSACGYVTVRELRARDLSPHWVVAAAVSIAAIYCIYWNIWSSDYYCAPAYELARRHLRQEAGPAGLVELTPDEQALAAIGAGRPLPELATWRAARGEAPDWEEGAGFPLVLTSRAAWTEAPARARQDYEQIDAMLTVDDSTRFNPLWFLAARERSSPQDRRTIVVLRRRDAEVP